MDTHEAGLAALSFPKDQFTKVFGDVSDYDRVMKAMRGVDTVIHCAAMKNIEISEVNCPDCVRINVIGTQNVAEAALERGIKHAIAISSDKAVFPTTLYGATKQVGEHIWKAAGRIQTKTAFTILRSGNFWESNGNFLETWNKQKTEGKPLTLTDPDMQRFFIEVEDVADIILDLSPINQTVIPIMKEYNILDVLIMQFGDEQEYIVTGLRQGEKLRESLMYPDEKIISVCNAYMVVE
jgi:UDP-N-acetylglucosamine 4,6-dehydratase